jgi:hypothetical protein
MCLISTQELRTQSIFDDKNATLSAPKKRLGVFANIPEDTSEDVSESKQCINTSFEGCISGTTASFES